SSIKKNWIQTLGLSSRKSKSKTLVSLSCYEI
ncbi:MAG: hypothetical protein ACI8V8_000585, partial [Chitinophagales bacterium]